MGTHERLEQWQGSGFAELTLSSPSSGLECPSNFCHLMLAGGNTVCGFEGLGFQDLRLWHDQDKPNLPRQFFEAGNAV